MDVSESSPVPYSLSDIQLPDSPGSHVKSKDIKGEKSEKIDCVSDEEINENSHTDRLNKSNGETAHKLSSSQEDASESEAKDSSYSNDSPEKIKMIKGKRHSQDSSNDESDRNSSPCKKKSFKNEETSSNLASDNDSPKDALKKEKRKSKTEHTSESDNEKSSDSDKSDHYVESKYSSRDKHKRKDSRSSSSSSSSCSRSRSRSRSRSSNSSPERRHSKKSIATKNKDFAEDDEINQISDKSSDEKSVEHKKKEIATKSPSDTTISINRRFKLKRDNIPIEISKKESPTKETTEANTLSKNTEKKENSHSASDKPAKQECVDEKEEQLEINYKPRRILLSNRKLNRKSSEDDNDIEPRSKRNKWESFSAAQKSSHDYSISTDSLKNWFPEFKLVSDTSMEVEQDDHSSSAIDEKNGDIAPGDTLNENESNMKHESTSQIDMEDSVSQEPNFEDTADLGPVSKIIFIQNLVRPFTLNQLKDLLKQSGKIVEEYFWIDKIKSKCFVMYETEKEAIKARNALNNTRWPSSNPKILSVQFSSIEELEKQQKCNEPPPLKLPEPPAIEALETVETRVSHTVEEHKRKDRERRKEKTKNQLPVREWDKDKVIQDSPERERPPKEEKSRSAEKKEKKEAKKRATEDTPAKLLDDLFQKTKSVPCIYWLPLTEEQAKAKEEAKKTRRLEREKRNQQLKEQEDAERRNRRARSSSRRREKENRKSSTRSRSPVSRRR